MRQHAIEERCNSMEQVDWGVVKMLSTEPIIVSTFAGFHAIQSIEYVLHRELILRAITGICMQRVVLLEHGFELRIKFIDLRMIIWL